MFATTHRQPGAARLSGAVLPRAVDAALTSRSGFARRAVGGAFYCRDFEVTHTTIMGLRAVKVHTPAHLGHANSQVQANEPTPTPKQTQQGFAAAARVAGVSRALTPPGLGTPWHSLKRVMRAPFGVYIVNA